MKRSRTLHSMLLSGVFFVLSCCVSADVQLPNIFSDNMVLQRGMKIPVWGKAAPGEKVTVSFAKDRADAVADSNGKWKLSLGPKEAGGPFEMTVAGKNTLVFKNVLVGEVWACSGQSNMQFSLSGAVNSAEEIAQATYPRIRLFSVRRTVAESPQEDAVGSWSECSPETAAGFSAVGYFFGRELHKALDGVPIGLIHTSWGGTPAEAWTSRPTLEATASLRPFLEYWKEEIAASDARLAEYEKRLEEWKEAVEKAKAEEQTAPAQPKRPEDRRRSPHRPASLYNAMIAPLVPYAARGAIWYQGESNATLAYQYRELFPTMIQDWRRAWGKEDLAFLFVQLANFRAGWCDPRAWAELREAQLMTLSLPHTGMAVSIDIGETYDIHPKNKQDVGRRLALAARAVSYGQKITYSGPIYTSMTKQGDRIRLRFKHVGGGLVSKGGPLKGFVIANESRKFFFAEARIDGETVVVHSDAVADPVAVRYGWWDDPKGCNLYNKEDLPASPFRTDTWPGVTAGVQTPRDPQADARFCEVPEDPSLPRVLLIGDSISIGYTKATRELLEAKANVQRIPWNGGDTNRGLERLDEALGDLKWNVIHFNFGLHDLHYTNERHQVPIEQYERNLLDLVKRLKGTEAKLIWASTTPVPEGASARRPGDEVTYNTAAKKIMQENDVVMNDLYTFALPKLKDLQLTANVHFTEAGSRALAEEVAKSILLVLGAR